MKQTKRYISPGAWFAMDYPADWSEFEDSEEAFLFYNPDEWTGNFRISAYRGEGDFGAQSVSRELHDNPSATPCRIGRLHCAYSCEDFEEDGHPYTTHLWVAGLDDIAFDCSFTVPRGASKEEAEQVIASLQVRRPDTKYPPEIIPIRLSEIVQIDEAYERISTLVKDTLKKDFQGLEEDLPNMQQLVDEGRIPAKKRELWLAMGITLCVILTNEADGMEWRTLIDGNREAPVLIYPGSDLLIDPMKLVWSKVKAGQPCNLIETYQTLFDHDADTAS